MSEDRDYLQEHLDWLEKKISEAEETADWRREEKMIKQWEEKEQKEEKKCQE